ncbi:MAG TPA: transporter substrate-binding domain-containing protein [Gaiellales bacterium]|jgi:ABC-type amino acid transport substrate-binding protein|nr:transporter substrate-binding domain-containing protein [Gaiellales bacterium]
MNGLVSPGALTLCCSDMAAPPLFWTEGDGTRHGYEPGAAGAVAGALGLEVRWIFRQWADFARALAESECDGIWCGSAITPEREQRFLYTRPYAVFDESVVVRAGDAVAAAADLRGRRVGAIAGSTNMALAETFEGAECVPFDGVTDDVFGDMLRALQIGEVDAVVDDDVAFLGIERTYPDIRVAFTVKTRNRWGCALRLGDADLKSALDDAIAQADLPAVWRDWLPSLTYPL